LDLDFDLAVPVVFVLDGLDVCKISDLSIVLVLELFLIRLQLLPYLYPLLPQPLQLLLQILPASLTSSLHLSLTRLPLPTSTTPLYTSLLRILEQRPLTSLGRVPLLLALFRDLLLQSLVVDVQRPHGLLLLTNRQTIEELLEALIVSLELVLDVSLLVVELIHGHLLEVALGDLFEIDA